MKVDINELTNPTPLSKGGIVGFSRKLNCIITPVLVFLMLFQAILSGTIFKGLQVSVELVLLMILLTVILIERRLHKEEVILLVLFLFTQVGSFIVNDFATFMLNAKQFGLAIFSLVYFRRYQRESFLIHLIFIACVILVLLQYYIFIQFPFDIGRYLRTLSGHTATRPLGIFLSFHFSAFFIAICLIGYTYKRKVFFLDFYILLLINVKTSIFAYAGQKIITFINRRVGLFKSEGSQWLLFIGALVFVSTSLNLVLDIIINYYTVAYSSGRIILAQLANPGTFLSAIYILPSNILEHSNTLAATNQLGKHDGANEVSLVVYLVQGGFFVTIMYLHLLTKTLSKYRMFILLSLLHYSFLLNPLVIYTMCMFEHWTRNDQIMPHRHSTK